MAFTTNASRQTCIPARGSSAGFIAIKTTLSCGSRIVSSRRRLAWRALAKGFRMRVASPDGSRSFRVTYLHAIEEEERGGRRSDGGKSRLPTSATFPPGMGAGWCRGMVGEKAERPMLRTLHKDTRRLPPRRWGRSSLGFLPRGKATCPKLVLRMPLPTIWQRPAGITRGLGGRIRCRGEFRCFCKCASRWWNDRGRALAWGRDLAALQDRLAERNQSKD